MRVQIEVTDHKEGKQIRRGLEDPGARAFIKVVGTLSTLPNDRAKRRVMQFAADHFAEEEFMNARPDTHMADAAKLTAVIIDVTKRWFGSEDTADARVVALAYAGALGAFLAQVSDHEDRTFLVMKTCEALVVGTNVPLRVERWDDLPAPTEEQRQ